MVNVHRPPAPETRLKKECAEAKALYIEKRTAEAKLKEINRRLRALSYTDPAAVERARAEIPFRKARGRPKQAQIVKIPEFHENAATSDPVDTN